MKKISPTWVPFNRSGGGKSYTPKSGEPASKGHLDRLKQMGRNKGKHTN